MNDWSFCAFVHLKIKIKDYILSFDLMGCLKVQRLQPFIMVILYNRTLMYWQETPHDSNFTGMIYSATEFPYVEWP